MKYLVAAGIACLIVGSVLALHWWVGSRLAAIEGQARATGKLPPNVPAKDLGVHVSDRLMFFMQLDHLLMSFWFILLPLILLICFGIAARLPGAKPAESPSAASSDKP
jgi:hypothetical protein